MGAVHEAAPAKDASERDSAPSRRLPAGETERAQLSARAEAYAERHATSRHANRALAAYASVVDNDERSSLRHLLGFDSYA